MKSQVDIPEHVDPSVGVKKEPVKQEIAKVISVIPADADPLLFDEVFRIPEHIDPFI